MAVRRVGCASAVLSLVASLLVLVGSAVPPAAADVGLGGPVGTVSPLPDGFIDAGSESISCPTATQCWISGRQQVEGGASNEYGVAILSVTDGMVGDPIPLADTSFLGTSGISCWSEDDCGLATMAWDPTHTTIGAGFSLVTDGEPSGATYIDTGPGQAQTLAIDCAADTCAVMGNRTLFGPGGPGPGSTSNFWFTVVRSGVADPVTQLPEGRAIHALKCLSAPVCLAAGLVIEGGTDHGYLARLDGAGLADEIDLGQYSARDLECSAVDDCIFAGGAQPEPDRAAVGRLRAGSFTVTPVDPSASGPTVFAPSISCDATLEQCLLGGRQITPGVDLRGLVVPVVDGAPGQPLEVQTVDWVMAVDCPTSACVGIGNDDLGNGSGIPRLVTDLELPLPPDVTPPTATITSPADGARFAIGEDVAAHFSCDDAGSGIASCVGTLDPGGPIADGDPIPTNVATLGTLTVTAVDAAGSTSTGDVGYEVVEGSAAGTVSGGGTISTGGTATEEQPVQTTVSTPPGADREITIVPQPTDTEAAGYSMFDQEVVLEGPPATAAAPYGITFVIDASALAGRAPADVEVFRNGVLVAGCTHPTAAQPSPCVASRGFVPGPSGDARSPCAPPSSPSGPWVSPKRCTRRCSGWIRRS